MRDRGLLILRLFTAVVVFITLLKDPVEAVFVHDATVSSHDIPGEAPVLMPHEVFPSETGPAAIKKVPPGAGLAPEKIPEVRPESRRAGKSAALPRRSAPRIADPRVTGYTQTLVVACLIFLFSLLASVIYQRKTR